MNTEFLQLIQSKRVIICGGIIFLSFAGCLYYRRYCHTSNKDTQLQRDDEQAPLISDQNQEGQISDNNNSQQQTIDIQVQQQSPPITLKKLQQLKQMSFGNRDVLPEFRRFVGDVFDLKHLVEHYGGKDENFNSQITQRLKGFRRIRGDGNCFYTAFVYQYFSIALQDEQEFQKLLKLVKDTPFLMFYNFTYEQEEEEEAQRTAMINHLQYLNESLNKQQDLLELMSDFENGEFYILSIIFLRNLCNELQKADEEVQSMMQALGADLSTELMEWEKECNYNELVINMLSRQLGLTINLFFISNQDASYREESYKNGKNEINIILSPGHFQIGII